MIFTHYMPLAYMPLATILRRMAESALSSGDAPMEAEARRLANILTARGLTDFKDLT